MFAPAPPRCCTRSSTRKESETFSILPSTNWSVNLPGKVIRWSVAIEPVTTTDMQATLSGERRAPSARAHRPVTRVGDGGAVGQPPPQLHAELRRSDHPEQGADRGAGGDDRVGVPQEGH